MPNPHSGETRDRVAERPKNLKEILYLAEQAAAGSIKVLPGKSWSLHYPEAGDNRTELLQGLLDGKYKPEDVVGSLKPDALIYDISDLDIHGLEAVSSRIKEASAFIQHNDYKRFAEFVAEMNGREADVNTITDLYSGIARSRVQKKLHDAYGRTGQQQIERAMQGESRRLAESLPQLPRSEKVLGALKMDWLQRNFGYVSGQQRDTILAELSGEERQLFEQLQEPFRQYVHDGSESAYQTLAEQIRELVPQLKKETKQPAENEQMSESMEELKKELEQYEQQVGPPGSPDDPAIPPDDEDEYHTPPPPPEGKTESKEQGQARPIFEITPPLTGAYASGKKSFYDRETKTWSKHKQLSAYNQALSSNERWTISGTIEGDVKSLPLPTGYAVDIASLKHTGPAPEISRDQNGCFYIKSDKQTQFSVDFLAEPTPFIHPPIAEDSLSLYEGALSAGTEQTVKTLPGNATQKAEAARTYILAHHFYPGGGDLKAAQALQHKLRSESSKDNYLQNLDNSEYLECYSANTLFVAMMRRAGVPARLVVGHFIESAKKDKAVINQNTGHAWSEIWDGSSWRRVDATPKPKPEDRKPNQDKDQGQEGQEGEASDSGDQQGDQRNGQDGGQPSEAKDGGLDQDNQQSQSEQQSDESGKQSDEQSSQSQSGNQQMKEMSEASDSEVSEGQEQVEQANEAMDQMNREMDQLKREIADAESFQDLEKKREEIEQADLLDEMKKELQEKINSMTEQGKQEMKDQLEQMAEDGFLDEQRQEQMEKLLEQFDPKVLDQLRQQIERENQLYNDYEKIREEVQPLVDQYFAYFAEKLPREEEMFYDESSNARAGRFDKRASQKHRNIIFGRIKNPRFIEPSIKPRFLASIMVDVSGSMGQTAGTRETKIESARKLLVFYSELFSRISKEFGYIQFSIHVFANNLSEIKTFEQDYDSPERYTYDDGKQSTVKVRLMEYLNASGGTNMLGPIKKIAGELTEQASEYPDFASAFYFVGDGGDTEGNAGNIRTFMANNDEEGGFGRHMQSAILMGNEQQRSELAAIFGDENTSVAPTLDELIEISMQKFEQDMGEYLEDKIK